MTSFKAKDYGLASIDHDQESIRVPRPTGDLKFSTDTKLGLRSSIRDCHVWMIHSLSISAQLGSFDLTHLPIFLHQSHSLALHFNCRSNQTTLACRFGLCTSRVVLTPHTSFKRTLDLITHRRNAVITQQEST